jgi:peptide deformylase
MAERKIVYIGDDVLRKKARRVRDFDDALNTLIDDMVETLAGASGVGLAAPQVGVSQRVIVIHLPDDEEAYGEQAGVSYEVVNPEIIKSSRETVEDIEACLSIPGYYGAVERSKMVVVRGQDRQGKEMRVKAYDWLARVFQHEIDHLDGVLYIDRTDEVWKVGEREAEEEAGEAAPAAD